MPCACLASLNNLLSMTMGVPGLMPGVSLAVAASLGLSASASLNLAAGGAADLSAGAAFDAALGLSVDASMMANLALTANMALMANLALGIDLSSLAATLAIQELGASIPALIAMLTQLPLFAIPNLAGCAQLGLAASVGLDVSMAASLSASMSMALSVGMSMGLSMGLSATLSAQAACMAGLGIDLSLPAALPTLAGAIPAINANLMLLESILSSMSMALLALLIAFFTPLDLLISLFGFGVLSPGFDFSAALSATASAAADMSASASASASLGASASASAAASAGMSASAAASAAAAASACASADFAAAISGLIIVPPLTALFLPLLMLILSCLGLGMVQTTPCSMCFLGSDKSNWLCSGLEAVGDDSPDTADLGLLASETARLEFLSSLQASAFDAKTSAKITAAQNRAAARAREAQAKNEADNLQVDTEDAENDGSDPTKNMSAINTWIETCNPSKGAIQIALKETSANSGVSMDEMANSEEFDTIAKSSGLSKDELTDSSESNDFANLSPKDIQDLSGLPGNLKNSLAGKGLPLNLADAGGTLDLGSKLKSAASSASNLTDSGSSGSGDSTDSNGLNIAFNFGPLGTAASAASGLASGSSGAGAGQDGGSGEESGSDDGQTSDGNGGGTDGTGAVSASGDGSGDSGSADGADAGKSSLGGQVAAGVAIGAVGAIGIGAVAALAGKGGKGSGSGSAGSGSGDASGQSSADGSGDGSGGTGDNTGSGGHLGAGGAGLAGAGMNGNSDDDSIPWHLRAKHGDPSRNVPEETYAVGDPSAKPANEPTIEDTEPEDDFDWKELAEGNAWHQKAKHDKPIKLDPEKYNDPDSYLDSGETSES